MAFTSDLRIAVICSSNMNRSMEAHAFLSKKGFYVKSFGTGDKVKIPGSAADKPNVYEFGTSYEEIYLDLLQKDKALYPFNMNKLIAYIYFQFFLIFHQIYSEWIVTHFR